MGAGVSAEAVFGVLTFVLLWMSKGLLDDVARWLSTRLATWCAASLPDLLERSGQQSG
jgi:hypothetical protein